ncbi:hypothetical protein [Ktedonospora formicarum]|uniref:Uncharacterized protein n=1 Tax=Ktedonospora formicarum TaxID=2778364 RepID=A0A8J3MQX0_9CHLR|nr:hypothetical protein [Ktedonospora formicarum]GHO43063.1 hypothetical protein KSX_12260 [Ktedonospora formicarum]
MKEMPQFRQQLDNLLRTRDVQRVRAFLIESGQWYEDAPADPLYAMWLMIAGSDKLSDLHAEAREWLLSNGHENVVEALLGKESQKKTKPDRAVRSSRGKQSQGNSGRKPPHKGREKTTKRDV